MADFSPSRTIQRSLFRDLTLARADGSAHRIEMRGDSMRKNQGKPNA